MPRLNGLRLIDCVRRHQEDIVIVGMTAYSSPTLHNQALTNGAIVFFEKPIEPALLVQVLDEQAERAGVTGSLGQIDLFDALQLLLLSRRQAVMTVVVPNHGPGEIFIEQGLVVHCEVGALSGIDAFNLCCAMEKGHFSTTPWREPEERTIDCSGEYLLMEAARLRDEQEHERKTTEVVVDDLQELAFDSDVTKEGLGE
jgi:hypothetical protein